MMETPSKGSNPNSTGKQVIVPFTVAIDAREQLPYTFLNLRDNVKNGRSDTLVVPTARCTLKVGDYSIVGLEESIAIERKSKQDLYGSVSQSRDNFVGRLERMHGFAFSCVVVEANWHELLTDPPIHTKYKPKSLCRTIQAWITRYNVHWLMVPNREYAEAFTFRLLQRLWLDKQEKKSAEDS